MGEMSAEQHAEWDRQRAEYRERLRDDVIKAARWFTACPDDTRPFAEHDLNDAVLVLERFEAGRG